MITGKRVYGRWKPAPEGTVKKTKAGYILVKRDGVWHFQHRLVTGAKPGEVVHHINSIKDDNRAENLQVFANSAEHRKQAHGRPVLICFQCGVYFLNRQPLYKISNGRVHIRKYCGRTCYYASVKGKPFSGKQGHPHGGYRK